MDRSSRSQRRANRCAAEGRAHFAGRRWRFCLRFFRFYGGFRRGLVGARLHCFSPGFLRWRNRLVRRPFLVRNLKAQ
jgi:hypothetical protein